MVLLKLLGMCEQALSVHEFIWGKGVEREERPGGSLEELQHSKFKQRKMNLPGRQRSFLIIRRKSRRAWCE